jgi:hypothetical protein
MAAALRPVGSAETRRRRGGGPANAAADAGKRAAQQHSVRDGVDGAAPDVAKDARIAIIRCRMLLGSFIAWGEA